MKRVLLAWLATALSFAASGCGRKADSDGEPNAPAATVEVRVRAIESRTFTNTVVAPGQWRAANELVIAAPFAGIVEALEPRAGDAVKRGETIGTLVTRESSAAVRGAELLLSQATDVAARDEATRALEIARHDLVRVPLVANATGTVVRRTAGAGAEVAEGAELIALVPAGAVGFEARVTLADAGRIAPGQAARVVLEGGGVVAARVQRRLPGAGAADQSALTWLAPVGPAAPDIIDRFGTATIVTGAARVALAIPDSALVEDDVTGELRVARMDSSGIAIWTPVHLGGAMNGWHELESPPLPAGTRVLVLGQHGLPDSTRVTIAP